jgi:hypothetical protein
MRAKGSDDADRLAEAERDMTLAAKVATAIG